MRVGRTLDPRIVPGVAALGFVTILIGGAIAGLAVEGAHDTAGAIAAFDPYLARVVRFTLWQAALSTLLSVLPPSMTMYSRLG